MVKNLDLCLLVTPTDKWIQKMLTSTWCGRASNCWWFCQERVCWSKSNNRWFDNCRHRVETMSQTSSVVTAPLSSNIMCSWWWDHGRTLVFLRNLNWLKVLSQLGFCRLIRVFPLHMCEIQQYGRAIVDAECSIWHRHSPVNFFEGWWLSLWSTPNDSEELKGLWSSLFVAALRLNSLFEAWI